MKRCTNFRWQKVKYTWLQVELSRPDVEREKRVKELYNDIDLFEVNTV